KKRGDYMFFVDEEHEANFRKMMDLYNLSFRQDLEYESAIYIASHPEIFKCYNFDEFSTEFGPLGYLLNDEDGVIHDTGALTGTTHALVNAGQSLFNGYEVSVSRVCIYGEETLKVFIQACKIRAGLYI
ncbi:hypothetical protein ACS2JV_27535, partial [Bacillus cereus group sp. BceL102]|uniref:hypothetical protein n=1 Tax=Bacillus cereus group sp. BceL102 TaxID=3445126 RepID=UPI003F291472